MPGEKSYAGLTRNELQALLNKHLSSLDRILKSQEYAVGNGGEARRNRRAELKQVQDGIDKVRRELAAIDRIEAVRARYGRSGRIMYARPAR